MIDLAPSVLANEPPLQVGLDSCDPVSALAAMVGQQSLPLHDEETKR
jgi:hypothetical protein